jgi:hypothetical protein
MSTLSSDFAVLTTTPTRRLAWRTPQSIATTPRVAPRQLRVRVTGRGALLATLVMLSAFLAWPALPSRATNAQQPSPGDVVNLLRTVHSMHVDASLMIRGYQSSEETGFEGDGVPFFGTMSFRDSGPAWRIQSELDPTRVSFLASMDTSFNGDMTVFTHDRITHKASFTNAGEHAIPYSYICHPWFKLAAWTSDDPYLFGYPMTRADLLALSDGEVSLAQGGIEGYEPSGGFVGAWQSLEFGGSPAEALTINYGTGYPSYRILTPVGNRAQPLAIEMYSPAGHLMQRSIFEDWRVPTWGENSAVDPTELPHLLTMVAFTPIGEVCADITVTITSCSIDVPIPADDMVTTLNGAESLLDEDTWTLVW